MLVALPTTVVIMRSRFAAIPKSIAEAALDLGARDWTTFRRVMLPLAAPAIASAFMLAFLTSFDEFIVAFFLAGTEPTLPLYIWNQLRFPEIAADRDGARHGRSSPCRSSSPALAEILRHRGLSRRCRPAPADPSTTKRNRKRRTAMAFDLKSTSDAWREPASPHSRCCFRRLRSRRSPRTSCNISPGPATSCPEFNKSFLAAHPDGVEASMFGDDDDAFTKVKAGFRPDVAHPCYDKVARWNKEGLLQPIDTKRIKNWDSIFPVFRNLPDLQAGDGKVWMVPWDWGNTSILYRTDLVEGSRAELEPAVGQAICRPHGDHRRGARHAGRRGAAGRRQSVRHDGRPRWTRWPTSCASSGRCCGNYTTDMTSVEQSLSSGELVAAMTWNASATALKKQGVPVEFMKPKEGMLTWACGFVMLKDAKNVDLAYDFINSRLETESGKYLIEAYGYGSSTSTAFAAVPKEELDKLQLPADPEVMLKTTVFTGPMKQNDDLAKMFEKVKAGG